MHAARGRDLRNRRRSARVGALSGFAMCAVLRDLRFLGGQPLAPHTMKAPAEPEAETKIVFVWFKYTCCCSWLVLTIFFAVFILACAAGNALNAVAADICTQPELAPAIANGTSCGAALECFGACNNQYDIITSVRIRQCLLGDADITSGVSVEVDSVCTYNAATLAYGLAQRYRNSSVDIGQARTLFTQEVQESSPASTTNAASSARRLRPANGGGAAAGAVGGLRVHDLARATLAAAFAAVTGASLADATAAFTTATPPTIDPRRRLSNHITLSETLSPAQALRESYANTAVAVSLALVVTGRLSALFGWIACVAFFAMLSPLLGLRGLGNTPPRCCDIPVCLTHRPPSAHAPLGRTRLLLG